MKAILGIGSLVGLLGSIVVACSSTPAVPPPPDNTVASFCSDWATAKCQLSTLCQFDVAACQTFQTTVCTTFATNATASGARQYNQPNGKACIDQLNAAYGGAPSTISATAYAATNDACNLAFLGNQAKGATCASTYDCTAGLACEQAFSATGNAPKVCESVTPKNLADPCGDPGDECQGNTYCGTGTAGPTCVAAPGVGATCTSATECGTNNRCLNATCEPLAAVGGACATDDDCASSLFCDPYPSNTGAITCASALTFAKGADDCRGIGGLNGVGTVADASVGDSAPAVDSATPVDSATGDSATGDSAASDAAGD